MGILRKKTAGSGNTYLIILLVIFPAHYSPLIPYNGGKSISAHLHFKINK